MVTSLQAKIFDITMRNNFEKYLYKCLAPMPLGKHKQRQEYVRGAIGKGFHKKLLVLNREIVGQIEYAPAGLSGYPIAGDNVIVMNCIWVLRKAKGHNFGRQLLNDMMESEKSANGFATIALENHWSPWLRKWQMEKLGFKSLESIQVTHKIKHKELVFSIHLMWLPRRKEVEQPKCNWQRLLKGTTFCSAHPLYRPRTWKGNIFERK